MRVVSRLQARQRNPVAYIPGGLGRRQSVSFNIEDMKNEISWRRWRDAGGGSGGGRGGSNALRYLAARGLTPDKLAAIERMGGDADALLRGEGGQPKPSFIEGIARGVADFGRQVVKGGLDVIDTPGAFLRALTAEALEQFTDIEDAYGGNVHNTGKGFSLSDVIKNTRDNVGAGDYIAEADMPHWAKVAVGFAGEVILDPTTYLVPEAKLTSLGGGGVKAIARALTTKGVKELGEEGAKTAAAKVLKARTPSVLTKQELASIGAKGGIYFQPPGMGTIGRALRIDRPLKKLGVPEQIRLVSRETKLGRAAAKASVYAHRPVAKVLNSRPARFITRVGWNGELPRFQEWLRSGDPERAYRGLWGLTARGEGRGAGKSFKSQMAQKVVDLFRRIDQQGIDTVQLYYAVSGSKWAEERVGKEIVQEVRDLFEEARNLANRLADVEGTGHEWLRDRGELYVPRFWEKGKEPSGIIPDATSVHRQVYGYEPGDVNVFLGRTLEDPNVVGKGIPDQMKEAARAYGMDPETVEKLFKDDLREVLPAYIDAIGDQVAREYEARLLVKMGIFDDLYKVEEVAESVRANWAREHVESAKRYAESLRRDADYERTIRGNVLHGGDLWDPVEAEKRRLRRDEGIWAGKQLRAEQLQEWGDRLSELARQEFEKAKSWAESAAKAEEDVRLAEAVAQADHEELARLIADWEYLRAERDELARKAALVEDSPEETLRKLDEVTDELLRMAVGLRDSFGKISDVQELIGKIKDKLADLNDKLRRVEDELFDLVPEAYLDDPLRYADELESGAVRRRQVPRHEERLEDAVERARWAADSPPEAWVALPEDVSDRIRERILKGPIKREFLHEAVADAAERYARHNRRLVERAQAEKDLDEAVRATRARISPEQATPEDKEALARVDKKVKDKKWREKTRKAVARDRHEGRASLDKALERSLNDPKSKPHPWDAIGEANKRLKDIEGREREAQAARLANELDRYALEELDPDAVPDEVLAGADDVADMSKAEFFGWRRVLQTATAERQDDAQRAYLIRELLKQRDYYKEQIEIGKAHLTRTQFKLRGLRESHDELLAKYDGKTAVKRQLEEAMQIHLEEGQKQVFDYLNSAERAVADIAVDVAAQRAKAEESAKALEEARQGLAELAPNEAAKRVLEIESGDLTPETTDQILTEIIQSHGRGPKVKQRPGETRSMAEVRAAAEETFSPEFEVIREALQQLVGYEGANEVIRYVRNGAAADGSARLYGTGDGLSLSQALEIVYRRRLPEPMSPYPGVDTSWSDPYQIDIWQGSFSDHFDEHVGSYISSTPHPDTGEMVRPRKVGASMRPTGASRRARKAGIPARRLRSYRAEPVRQAYVGGYYKQLVPWKYNQAEAKYARWLDDAIDDYIYAPDTPWPYGRQEADAIPKPKTEEMAFTTRPSDAEIEVLTALVQALHGDDWVVTPEWIPPAKTPEPPLSPEIVAKGKELWERLGKVKPKLKTKAQKEAYERLTRELASISPTKSPPDPGIKGRLVFHIEPVAPRRDPNFIGPPPKVETTPKPDTLRQDLLGEVMRFFEGDNAALWDDILRRKHHEALRDAKVGPEKLTKKRLNEARSWRRAIDLRVRAQAKHAEAERLRNEVTAASANYNERLARIASLEAQALDAEAALESEFDFWNFRFYHYDKIRSGLEKRLNQPYTDPQTGRTWERLKDVRIEKHVVEVLRDGWRRFGTRSQGPAEMVEIMVAAQRMGSPGWLQTVMKHADTAIAAWRSWVLANPGTQIRNFLGGAINNWFADIDPASYKAYAAASRARATGKWEQFAAKHPDVAEAFQRAEDMGIMASGRMIHEVPQRVGETSSWKPWSPHFAPLAGFRSGFHLGKRLVFPGGQQVENFMRGSLFIDRYLKTRDVTDAFGAVVKYHFDYDDLGTLEHAWMRRVIPFYTWTRKNLPLQLEMLAKRPNKFLRYFQLKRSVEAQSEEEGIVPSWFEDSMAMRLPLEMAGGNLYFFPDFHPSMQLFEATDFGMTMGMVNPFIRSPFEWAMNKQLFKDRGLSSKHRPVPTIMQAIPGLMAALDGLGIAEWDGEQGTWTMRDKDIWLVEQNLPLIARARRLLPNDPRFEERHMSSILSTFLGIGLRPNSTYEKEMELWRRYGFLKDREALMERLGAA